MFAWHEKVRLDLVAVCVAAVWLGAATSVAAQGITISNGSSGFNPFTVVPGNGTGGGDYLYILGSFRVPKAGKLQEQYKLTEASLRRVQGTIEELRRQAMVYNNGMSRLANQMQQAQQSRKRGHIQRAQQMYQAASIQYSDFADRIGPEKWQFRMKNVLRRSGQWNDFRLRYPYIKRPKRQFFAHGSNPFMVAPGRGGEQKDSVFTYDGVEWTTPWEQAAFPSVNYLTRAYRLSAKVQEKLAAKIRALKTQRKKLQGAWQQTASQVYQRNAKPQSREAECKARKALGAFTAHDGGAAWYAAVKETLTEEQFAKFRKDFPDVWSGAPRVASNK